MTPHYVELAYSYHITVSSHDRWPQVFGC